MASISAEAILWSSAYEKAAVEQELRIEFARALDDGDLCWFEIAAGPIGVDFHRDIIAFRIGRIDHLVGDFARVRIVPDQHVADIRGAGAFVMTAGSYSDFTAAMVKNLVREIRGAQVASNSPLERSIHTGRTAAALSRRPAVLAMAD